MDKLPKQEIRNVQTGLVRTSDKYYEAFLNHASHTYTMEKIPTSINIMDVEYFLPMVDGKIDGYYKVDKVYFGADGGNLRLKLNLSTYIPLGDEWVHIYKTKMQAGELISYETMMKLYEK